MKNKIWLSSPHMCGTEENYVKSAFETNWIAPLGPHVDNFENKISDRLCADSKMETAVLVSGTAALHLALIILDVKPGDIVIVQSFTFCGTTNPVSYLGAEIVFVDSELETWNMCPVSLEKALKDNVNKQVKAIIPVHLYGMPVRIDLIQDIANKYGVPIIEDAAEALGSTFKGKACGTFGLMSVLSFNGNKIITTSGGGALVSENKEYIKKARFLATQARDVAPHYQHSQIGYNYRMSNVLAGIGCGQIDVLEERVMQRRKINTLYRDFFKNISGVTLQTEPNSDFFSNYWLTSVFIDPTRLNNINREKVRLELEAENIESRPLWKPMHLQPIYKGYKFYGTNVCLKLFENGLCLPSGSNLNDEEIERIFHVLTRIFKNSASSF